MCCCLIRIIKLAREGQDEGYRDAGFKGEKVLFPWVTADAIRAANSSSDRMPLVSKDRPRDQSQQEERQGDFKRRHANT